MRRGSNRGRGGVAMRGRAKPSVTIHTPTPPSAIDISKYARQRPSVTAIHAPNGSTPQHTQPYMTSPYPAASYPAASYASYSTSSYPAAAYPSYSTPAYPAASTPSSAYPASTPSSAYAPSMPSSDSHAVQQPTYSTYSNKRILTHSTHSSPALDTHTSLADQHPSSLADQHPSSLAPQSSPAITSFAQPSPALTSFAQPSPAKTPFPKPSPAPASFPQPSPAPASFAQPSPAMTSFPQPSPAPASFPQPSPAPASFPQPSPAISSFPQPSPAPASFPQPSPRVSQSTQSLSRSSLSTQSVPALSLSIQSLSRPPDPNAPSVPIPKPHHRASMDQGSVPNPSLPQFPGPSNLTSTPQRRPIASSKSSPVAAAANAASPAAAVTANAASPAAAAPLLSPPSLTSPATTSAPHRRSPLTRTSGLPDRPPQPIPDSMARAIIRSFSAAMDKEVPVNQASTAAIENEAAGIDSEMLRSRVIRPRTHATAAAPGSGPPASSSPSTPSTPPPPIPALKLFVCQKDESVLLRPWLSHALSLVDAPGDVFVVDDNSSEPSVLETLAWAEGQGVRVLRVRPPQPRAFERKNMIFTDWVRSHPQNYNAFFIPMDCDEFLAHRENDTRAMIFGVRHSLNKLKTHQIGTATLPLSVTLSPSRDKIRNDAIPRLAERGFGTIYVKRFRNFSHAQGYFSSVAESKWCGINRKVVVYGGGSTVLTHPSAIANRGYHDTSTGRQLGWGNSLCFVEFHNLPLHIRKSKSAEMAKVAAQVSLEKYVTESRSTKQQYEREQEVASHMRPSAHSPEFASLMAHIEW